MASVVTATAKIRLLIDAEQDAATDDSVRWTR